MSDIDYNIVLVDNDSNALRMNSDILKQAGYKTHPFLNGLDALSFLKFTDKTIDLIISEINMPYLDGISLLTDVKKITKYLSAPFFFLSKAIDDKIQLSAFQKGAVDCINKAVDNQLLLAKINSLLNTISINAVKTNILLKGSNKKLSIEEIINYCEQEKVNGAAYIFHLKENGIITFKKGVLNKFIYNNLTDTKAFEKINAWQSYNFIIVRGTYNPKAIKQLL